MGTLRVDTIVNNLGGPPNIPKLPIETLDSGGWGGSNIQNPGGINQQFVGPGTVVRTFNVLPITLTPGTWQVTSNVWADLSPNAPPNNSAHAITIQLPYSSSNNPEIVYSSKADTIVCRYAFIVPQAIETPLVSIFTVDSNITFNQINGYWLSASDSSQRDLKINCWYTAIKLQ